MPSGVYYYPEAWQPAQWERDIKRMKELGFDFVHMAEFAWAKMEPTEGRYDFSWLDACVAYCQKYGLKVVLCTPSPCPPAWLATKHPEIMIVNEDGSRWEHGSRLGTAYTHPVYQQYLAKIIDQLGMRYGKNTAVMGWQLDNEPHYGNLYDYSPHALNQFRIWLQAKYKNNLDSLNFAWGRGFWSIDISDWAQIKLPNSKTKSLDASPHALLDFQLFNAEELAKGLRWQAQRLRKWTENRQWITTNYAYMKFLPSVDLFLNRSDLDFSSHTMYLTNTYLNYAKDPLGFRLGSGMELAFAQELAQSMSGQTGIMELQPGQINWGSYNSLPYTGAVRMWVWHAFGLGEKFVCTYRYRQPLAGSEQYHHGVMQTDGITLSAGGKEFVQAVNEIAGLKKRPKVVDPEAEGRKVAFLWKQANVFDLQNFKHTQQWDTWQHYFTYYEALKTMGCKVTFLEEKDDFDPKSYPFLIAPSYQLMDWKLVQKLKTYVEKGGNLVLSCRSGQKDPNGHLWEGKWQQPILDLIGAEVVAVDQLPPGTVEKVKMQDDLFDWSVWADVLKIQSKPFFGSPAESWASYSGQIYNQAPAVIHRNIGKGSVTYLGVWSESRELELQVLRKLFTARGATILNLPRYVFVDFRDGYGVAVNYTSQKVTIPVKPGKNIIYGSSVIGPGEICVWEH